VLGYAVFDDSGIIVIIEKFGSLENIAYMLNHCSVYQYSESRKTERYTCYHRTVA